MHLVKGGQGSDAKVTDDIYGTCTLALQMSAGRELCREDTARCRSPRPTRLSRMRVWGMVSLLAVFFIAYTASGDQFSSSHIFDLGKSFNEKIGDGKLYFVKFYAPWCGHCKKLAPAWNELGQSFEQDTDVVIAHVDCTKAKAVCSEAKIGGYPTLKLFYDGEEIEAYRGSRDLTALKSYVSEQKVTLLQETEA